jgi:hypothetical protein
MLDNFVHAPRKVTMASAEPSDDKKPTEAELRASLGASPDPETSTQDVIADPPPRNPYLVTLAALSGVSALIAVICYIVSVSAVDGDGDPDVPGRLLAVGYATNWVLITSLFFIAFLVLGAVTWKRPGVDAEQE